MVPSSWMCMVLSSSAQASRQHAVHRRTTSKGWLRLLSTTEARTVSVQCLDVLLLEAVNAWYWCKPRSQPRCATTRAKSPTGNGRAT